MIEFSPVGKRGTEFKRPVQSGIRNLRTGPITIRLQPVLVSVPPAIALLPHGSCGVDSTLLENYTNISYRVSGHLLCEYLTQSIGVV
jgi:hypothetical protein